ncbi:hypothetical protein BO82DRAFT_217974 [Aspergillus uvarum CBS 121591]|uniref:Uncharacterized protein n=1 Tax=Aspergillus uvarum CBS 121591 TaxID=1448315 RepID=A0A319D7X5_9EURO|nr:hypothetical protein BO82DRAFT_217974 [Aspergillus uvarum CBS 121591]PYH76052.1 hypothetical protein BO82DRAFT_217974 [Aspergillus uvarum CBS 121591]
MPNKSRKPGASTIVHFRSFCRRNLPQRGWLVGCQDRRSEISHSFIHSFINNYSKINHFLGFIVCLSVCLLHLYCLLYTAPTGLG